MPDAANELWDVAQGHAHVDAQALARAVERAVSGGILDTRTRWLIRDSVGALTRHWGPGRVQHWLSGSTFGEDIRRVCEAEENQTDIAFPSLARRVVDTTKRETVLEFLQELSTHVATPTTLHIGGSIALILKGYLARKKEVIDLVDEVPGNIRVQHELLASFAQRYQLLLTHFQSHYLPGGWQNRVHSLGPFGKLHVFIVDAYDVFTGKLFSPRTKDLDDLRELKPQLDRQIILTRFSESAGDLLSEAKLKQAAEKNWYVLFGEPLPS